MDNVWTILVQRHNTGFYDPPSLLFNWYEELFPPG
jgi:hypothetical protein